MVSTTADKYVVHFETNSANSIIYGFCYIIFTDIERWEGVGSNYPLVGHVLPISQTSILVCAINAQAVLHGFSV